MTRRPPMPPDGNVRRAHQRMAPGGRLWSESPVRGPAVRVVAAGDDPLPPDPPPAPTVDVWSDIPIAPALGDTTVWMSAFASAAPGQLGVFAAYGVGVGWVAPSGWTTLTSGTVGALDYLVGFREFTGADDVTLGTGLAPGWEPGAAGEGLGRVSVLSFDVGWEGTPTATAVESPLVTSVPVLPGGAWSGLWQMVAGAHNPQLLSEADAEWLPPFEGFGSADFTSIGTRKATIGATGVASMFSGSIWPQRVDSPLVVSGIMPGDGETNSDRFDGVSITVGLS